MENKKKIIISNFDDIKHPDYSGGGAYVIHETAKYLSKEFNVTILTGKYKGAKNHMIDGVYYKRIGSDILGSKVGQLLFQFILPYYAVEENYDIWLESFTPPFSTAFLQLFTKKPVVGLTHFLNAEEKSKEYKLPFFIVQQLGLKTYNYFIALSYQIEQKIRKSNNHANIRVIPNGISKPENKYKYQKTKNYILFLGRIEINQKGLDMLLDAFEQFAKHAKDNLVIVGSGSKENEEQLNIIIAKKHLQKRVFLKGRILGDEKINLIAQAKFVVMPSRYENFSIVALEALALGKTIVCFDIEGLKWIPQDTAIKAIPFSSDNFSQNMLRASRDNNLRTKIKIKTLKLASSYTWTAILKKYHQYINQILEEKK